MPTAATAATGVASVIVAAATQLWGAAPPPAVNINTDGSFLSPWQYDEHVEPPPCNFYNATYQYTGALCSHFALARMSQSTQQEAFNRALSCAAYYETDCILSPEIGLSIPAAFVYDPENGLKMVIAPKLTDTSEAGDAEERLVELRDPDGKKRVQIHMQTAVGVEYLLGGKRLVTTETLYNTSAYCVQMLRLAFDTSCWQEID